MQVLGKIMGYIFPCVNVAVTNVPREYILLDSNDKQ